MKGFTDLSLARTFPPPGDFDLECAKSYLRKPEIGTQSADEAESGERDQQRYGSPDLPNFSDSLGVFCVQL
jgi:hypothetical protein